MDYRWARVDAGNQLDISELNAKAETALGILFREGF